ncbi:transcription termination factor MTERF5, chloroplastic isoform X1 [Camellia sinensis]|uniref:Uncharacterized protein n=1 Tax=Camellia sinensis var. sinensis TaxID=542762 RepID=A0A4S4E585_CAMSN|nr:transcription termination factor MTERF5, chloroplastic isoform X1 [Camellia sinensis]THG10495.1 hypothetical protein TEA_012523 [Camellia sinensis var. sinensis]
MRTLLSQRFLSPFPLNTLYSKPIIIRPFFLCFFSSYSSVSSPLHTRSTTSTTPISNLILYEYLIKTFSFSEPQAISISKRFPPIKTLKNPKSVVQLLKQLGFSNAQIRSSIHCAPQILFSNVDRTLKPKLQFFLDLGLSGSDLGKFMSRNSTILTRSLDKKLIPCIDVIKKILVNDNNNQDLIRVMRRCKWVTFREPRERLLSNVAFLESCGIVGSQLSMLLTRQPRLFVLSESKLRDLVLRVLDMGFSIESRMLVHALYTVSCMTGETFNRKLELFRSFGFLESECMEMFRRTPGLLRTSEDKLRVGIEFFLNDIKFERSVLVHRPNCLMHSMEERVIPRYRVLQVMKSKGLLKKMPSLIHVLSLTEEEFLAKFISKFRDDAKELLVAYKGHLLNSSEE